MRIQVWWVAALAVAACTDATTITGGVCGNYVLEPENREDCDRPGETCTADCRIACTPAATAAVCAGAPDGVCCPAGAVCGADQRCHVATGLFEPVDRSTQFTAVDFAVGRVDDDLIDDVLGASSGSIEARFGHAATPLDRSATRRAPFATGSFAIGDTTGDDRLDVLFPTGAGIFGFTSSGPEPEAITFPARRNAGVQHARIATLGGSVLARVDYQHAAARFMMTWESPQATAPICNGMPPDPQHHLFGRGLHVMGQLTAFVVGIPGASSFAICVERPYISTRIDVMQRTGDGETFFADVMGTTCPELFVPVLSAGREGTLMLPGIGTGPCTLGSPTQLVTADGPIGIPLMQLRAGAIPALVTSSGIFDVRAAPTRIVASTRSWRYAVKGDFNNDGLDDFATAGLQEDVEVIEQRAVPGQWNVVRIPTPTIPVQLATGDFDGDGHDDLAIATLISGLDRTARIAVTYGGPTLAFDPPAVAGVIDDFRQLIATQLVDPSLPDGFDHSDDLVIAHDGATASSQAKLTYMFGSASRNVTSPWLFQSKFGGQRDQAGEGWAVVIGRFGAQRTPGAVAAFTVSMSGPVQEPAPLPDPLPLPLAGGRAPGAAVPVPPRDTSHPAFVPLGWNGADATFDNGGEYVVDCRNGGATLCPEAGARFGSVSVPQGELLLGFSSLPPSGQTCGYYHLAMQGGQPPQLTPIPCANGMVAKLNSVSAMRAIGPLADVDHGVLVTQPPRLGASDHTARIWSAAINPAPPPASGAVLALKEEIDLTAEVAAAVGVAVACMDAVAGELATTGDGYGTGPELIVACRVKGTTRLLARYAAPVRGAPPRYRELLDIGADVAVRIRTGDVNGDGLDDLVYATGTELHVRVQCDVHAEGCR